MCRENLLSIVQDKDKDELLNIKTFFKFMKENMKFIAVKLFFG